MNSKIINKKKVDLNKSIDSLEELIWLLDSIKITKFKAVPRILREIVNNSNDSSLDVADEYKSPNPNVHFLIGVLPRLFMDEVLFPSNQSISQFAEDFLGVKVSRQDKRSKYELIGLIVCETDRISDSMLHTLVKALSKIIANEEQLTKIKEEKSNNNFSWNETIQKLTERKNVQRDN